MSEKKDWLDIVEIFSKFVVPIAVAITAYFWNVENSKQTNASNMVKIAVGILTAPPDETGSPDAIRDWAIEVMQSPKNPPVLTKSAADELKTQKFPNTFYWDLLGGRDDNSFGWIPVQKFNDGESVEGKFLFQKTPK